MPICSPLYEGHVGMVRLELCSGISLKFYFESKLQLPCYGIVLRFVFHFSNAWSLIPITVKCSFDLNLHLLPFIFSFITSIHFNGVSISALI